MILPLLQGSRACFVRSKLAYHFYPYCYSAIPSRTYTLHHHPIKYSLQHRRHYSIHNAGDANNNIKKEDDKQVDNSILLIEKSLGDKTYKKFYFSKEEEDTSKSSDKPKSNVGQAKILLFVRDCFLPEGYPHSVAKDYTMYQVWQFVQNVAGSTAFVLATHACLTSVGVGTATATPVAATMNWLLRDGLGCIGLVLYAGKFATNLDLDIKRFKFLGDILHNVGVGIEIITPLFPGKFLLLASIGNAMKSIAGLVLGSTKASFNKMFSLQENMADVTAKYQSQGLVAYLLGMGIGIGVANFIPNVYGHFAAYLFLSSIHLWASINGLNRITLNTLNEQRLNIVLEHFFSSNDIIMPSKAKQFERLFVLKIQTEKPAIVLGSSVKDAFKNPANITKSIEAFKGEKYIITYRKDELRVVLHETLEPLDLLRAYFNAYYLKAILFTMGISKEKKDSDEVYVREKKEICEDLRAFDDLTWLNNVASWKKNHVKNYHDENSKHELPEGWREKSHEFTNKNFDNFVLRLEVAGWNISNIPLPSYELRSWWRIDNVVGNNNNNSNINNNILRE